MIKNKYSVISKSVHFIKKIETVYKSNFPTKLKKPQNPIIKIYSNYFL